MTDDDGDPAPDDRAFAFVAALARLDDPQAVTERLLAEVKPFGLDVLMAARIPPSRPPTDDDILLHGWPAPWLERYRDETLFQADPIAQYGRRADRPFIWSELPDRYRRAFDASGSFMGAAREHALVDGYCVPVPGVLGRRAIIGFAGSGRLDLSAAERAQVEVMALHAVRRADDLRQPSPAKNPFTRREKEVLYWAAQGKSVRDTAEIMGIAEATVASHLLQVRRKLDVDTTQHAVALAIENALLSHP